MHIILDSNLMHGRTQPDKDGGLREILSLKNDIGWRVYLPQPVKYELIQGYNETLKNVEKARDSFLNVAARSDVLVSEITCHIEDAKSAYVARLDQMCRTWQIEELPFPKTIEVESLFQSAVTKTTPFDASGNSFRDAVIYLVAENLARESASEQVYLVSNDNGMNTLDLSKSPENLSIMSPNDMKTFLRDHLDKEVRALQRQIAAEMLKSHAEDILLQTTALSNNVALQLGDRFTKVVYLHSCTPKDLVELSVSGTTNTLNIAANSTKPFVFTGSVVSEALVEAEVDEFGKQAALESLNQFYFDPFPLKPGDTDFTERPEVNALKYVQSVSMPPPPSSPDIDEFLKSPYGLPNPTQKTLGLTVVLKISGKGLLKKDKMICNVEVESAEQAKKSDALEILRNFRKKNCKIVPI